MPLITKQAPLLYDTYAVLLTERQRTLLDLAWQQDLSLSEIASELGISRQAAQSGIRHAHAALTRYESLLGFMAKEQVLLDQLEQLKYSFEAKKYDDCSIQLNQICDLICATKGDN